MHGAPDESGNYNNMIPQNRILLTRNDKLGDVILATPVIASLAASVPQAEIWALVRPACKEVVQDNPHLQGVLLDEGGAEGFSRLLDQIRSLKFDAALILFSDFRMGLLCCLAGIPRRIGPASKIAQIFYTRRIKQHRSKAERHESDYNLELAQVIGAQPLRRLEVVTSNQVQAEVEDFFNRLPRDRSKLLVGIHPGSGGSDRNWRPERYAEFMQAAVRELGADVLITSGPEDKEILRRVTAKFTDKYFAYPPDHGLQALAEILRHVDVFVSGSTGPMHLAAAVGTPTVSLFSPLWVCRPERWGPLGNPQVTLQPDLPICHKCRPQKCGHPHCVELVSAKQVLDAVRSLWL